MLTTKAHPLVRSNASPMFLVPPISVEEKIQALMDGANAELSPFHVSCFFKDISPEPSFAIIIHAVRKMPSESSTEIADSSNNCMEAEMAGRKETRVRWSKITVAQDVADMQDDMLDASTSKLSRRAPKALKMNSQTSPMGIASTGIDVRMVGDGQTLLDVDNPVPCELLDECR